MSKLSSIKPLFYLVSVLMFVFSGSSVTAGEPRKGGTLIVANEADLGEMDPHITCATSSARWVMNHIAEPLVQQDMTDDKSIPPPLIPGIAQSWDVSDDGKTYTFYLKKRGQVS